MDELEDEEEGVEMWGVGDLVWYFSFGWGSVSEEELSCGYSGIIVSGGENECEDLE